MERIRNDRLIAAATHAHTHEHIKTVEDLPGYLLRKIEGFFAQYNQLRGKQFEPLRQGRPERARIVLERDMEAFRSKANLPPRER
ncbi:hypothetical protein EAH89_24500 [Roseomonas nepalensis]|uniref:inorganic diphosphatase n=1 Tax=Muricoccus nepalensis TaxID=1854500 RepID=A0A502FAR2_9PROT|nr:inorganic diphosphatase [Roseomonas nepalensis]TPG46477.1 hypothetical protein EAH89_24500 [Roseomonas nepalensis]